MKHNHNHDNAPSAAPELMPVHFEYTHLTAGTVCVAGTFNNWNPTTKSMHQVGNGHWLKEAFLPPGDYEYCLIVDGEWIPDPHARESVTNPFGGRNSILKVAHSPEAAHRTDALNLPLKHTNKKNTKKL